jgi:hypothetical protein
MISFLFFIFWIVFYIVGAGVTSGYAKHRWPKKMVVRTRYYQYGGSYQADEDENGGNRVAATLLWPFYWTFVWPFTKSGEITFSNIEKHAAKQIAQNKVRIADLYATRDQLAASNAELAAAEVEVEKEVAKL